MVARENLQDQAGLAPVVPVQHKGWLIEMRLVATRSMLCRRAAQGTTRRRLHANAAPGPPVALDSVQSQRLWRGPLSA